ncbi:IclR family transcriptional regulator [Rhizobium sp. LEGMi198b]
MKNPRGRPRLQKVGALKAGRTMADRAIDVLEAVSRHGPVSLRDLTTQLRIPASTAHRFLLLLEARGFVSMDPLSQRWEIDVRAFQVGNSYLRRTGLAEIARFYLAEIGMKSGETANLSVRHAGSMVVIAQVESHNPLRAFFRLGSQIPVHCSAAGKAVLSYLPPGTIEGLFDKRGLLKLTDRTVTSLPQLHRQLEEVRSRGWALDDEEQVMGMRCVAAPVWDRADTPVAALSLSGPTSRFDTAAVDSLSTLVKETAQALSNALRGL